MHDAARRILPQSGKWVLNTIRQDQAGSVLPILAAATLVLAGLIGGGVDMARGYKAERRLQAACDAGVLAGRRAVTDKGFNAAARSQANAYFNANFHAGAEGTTSPNFETTTPDNGNTIVGTARAEQSTVIMRLFGFETLPLAVTCTASMGVGNSDIMMVLDNTASMSFSAGKVTRIQALKTAMTNFYNTVQTSVDGTNARIRYAFVPYGTTVNVGGVLAQLDPDYIASTATYQTRVPVTWSKDAGASTTKTTEGKESKSGNETRLPNQYDSQSQCNQAWKDTSWQNDGRSNSSSSSRFDGETEKLYQSSEVSQPQVRSEYTCKSRQVTVSCGFFCSTKKTVWEPYRQNYKRDITTTTEDRYSAVMVTDSNKPFDDWLYKPVSVNVGSYTSYTGNPNAPFSAQRTPFPTRVKSNKTSYENSAAWDGCIIERDTIPSKKFTFESLQDGIRDEANGKPIDLDIDLAPTPGEPSTQWRPLWPQLAYTRNDPVPSLSGGSSPMSEYCTYRAQTFATQSSQDFAKVVAGMQALTMGTYHDAGLLWGARMSSPNGIFADNVNEKPVNGGTVSRHLIFMTDGVLQTMPGPDYPSTYVNTLYGIEHLDRRITGGDYSTSAAEPRHVSRTKAICEAIKARGIRLWVITFGTTLAATDLVGCSSPNSSFESSNAEELDAHFQEIAKQVGELRVTQ